MANAERISFLLFKHLRRDLTTDESVELAGWRNESPENQLLFDNLTNEDGLRDLLRDHYYYKNETWKKLIERVPELEQQAVVRKRRRIVLMIAVAVAIFVFILGVFWKRVFE